MTWPKNPAKDQQDPNPKQHIPPATGCTYDSCTKIQVLYLLARDVDRLALAAHGEGRTWLSDAQRGILGIIQPMART
ncbi:hypothetical protein AC578_10915 [Pseudocercospora eumusae]|uniref:Uncharacterized protein n=1 Tax=Pseudocercospora eumusae TaxID=321146 RepID=A0A139HFD5_9PEZI|nr:hypothetical protein AC578_10915 [Pseudocercospora eumusae]